MTNAVMRVLRACAGAGVVLVVMAGCALGGPGGTGIGVEADSGAAGGTGTGGTPPVSRARILITPEDGARDVRPYDRFTVEADQGTLTSVRVEDAEGERVRGRISADRRSWRPHPADSRLSLSAKYTVNAYAVDADGRRAAKHAVFTTLVPKNTVVGYFTPENGSTVGTGMIVSITFSRPVTDRAAVERAISVTSEPAVDVIPHWFGSGRLDFRPEHSWAPGTRVRLRLRLRDVEGAPGVYGTQSKDVRFTIGREQMNVVDAAAHTMTVRRGGKVLRVLPISAGSPSTPTYNGKMVISEKLRLTRMNGDTVGFGGEYDIPDVPHAMRLTGSGTFVHGSYWTAPGTFGQANTSHGCIGLLDVKGGGARTPAGWLFDHSLVGDVIEVVNSHDRTVAPDNGLGGWNMSWSDWTAR